MFIELVSGVKYPKITTVGIFLKRPFVDVLSSSRFFDYEKKRKKRRSRREVETTERIGMH